MEHEPLERPRLHAPGDDDPVPMTTEERSTWAYLAAVVLTAAGYSAVVVPQALAGPVGEVRWQVPLLVAIGVSVSLTVLGTVLGVAVSGARRARRGLDPRLDLGTDERDRAIGDRRTGVVSGAALIVVLALAMVDAPSFWIGNAVYAFGVLGAVLETATKIRAYRRGW